jgi:hypothetical protein
VELSRLLEHRWESEQATCAWKGYRDRLGLRGAFNAAAR